MSQRLLAREFFDRLRAGENEPNFFEREAQTLGVALEKLKANFITCKIQPNSVVALRTLYAIYESAPVNQPKLGGSLSEVDAEDLSLRQKAYLSQLGKVYNPDATKQDIVDDIMALSQDRPFSYITENYYAAHGAYSLDNVRQIFGDWLQARREAGLQLSRGQHQMQRYVAKHVSLDLYRQFYRQEVLPYANLYEHTNKQRITRMHQYAIASDIHDVACDPFTWAVFVDTCRRLYQAGQLRCIILNGDIFDLYEFSRFDIDPRGVDLVQRFDFVKRHIFAALREACPDVQIDFIIGNHDWRILRVLAEKTPTLKVILHDLMGLTLADIFGVHEYQINLISKGDLDFAAHRKPDIDKQVRRNYKVYDDCFVAAHKQDYGFRMSGTSGHTHKPLLKTTACLDGADRDTLSWMVTGSICRTDAHYVEGLDKSQNAFGIVHIDTERKRVQQELIIIPDNVAHVYGHYYFREDTADWSDYPLSQK